MHERILAYIREHELIKAGDRVGAAVSGGADSVALLRILLALRDDLGIVLSVMHFNHRIRREADDDERFVRQLADEHGLEFRRAEADTPRYAREHKISLETAARKLRYDYFRRLLGMGGERPTPELEKIATAHTMNDQAETVLMRVIRGAGTKGLGGIYPFQNFSHKRAAGDRAVVRPLLCLDRPEIEAYLQELKQPWRQDTMNLDPHHLRNRVRHQLLPVLERDFNPGILRVLSNVAEIARVDEDYFAGLISESAVIEKTVEGVRLQVAALKALPLALRRRLIRHCGERLELVLEFQHVEQVLGLAASHAGDGECELPGGWAAVRQGRELCFERWAQTHEGQSSYMYPLRVPGEVTVKEIGCVIKAFVRAETGAESGYNHQQFLDPAALEAGLVVRNWRPGDRFWPAHTKAPKKVKELLQKRHIAARERALWPVVSCGEVLVWMRGFAETATSLRGDGSKRLVIEEKVAAGGTG